MIRDPCWIRVDTDSFYVYALYDEKGFPFYIGKGKGSRVNNHVKPSLLKEKSHKSHKIKYLLKTQGYVKRDILLYCGTEEFAYQMEEFLIDSYGLRSEGGCLTNVLKSNSDFNQKALAIAQVNAAKANTKITQQVADEMFLIRKLNSAITFKELGKLYGVSGTRVSAMFCGKMPTIKVKTEHQPQKMKKFTQQDVDAIRFSKQSGLTTKQVCEKHSISKTHLFRILRGELKYLEADNSLENA